MANKRYDIADLFFMLRQATLLYSCCKLDMLTGISLFQLIHANLEARTT